jgi:hypothetical protein
VSALGAGVTGAYHRYLERRRVEGSDLDDRFAAAADLRSTIEALPLSA